MPAAPEPLHPRPENGVFETLLVADGRPIELEAHLARLALSLDGLFAARQPTGVRELVLDRARAIRLGRLRLTVAPDDAGSLAVAIVTAEVDPGLVFPATDRAVALHSLVVEGGLGAHKWADRASLERAGAAAHAGAVPLLLDRDDAVLEASRANVFAVRDGALATPAADGRILPGIGRARVMEIARRAGIALREEDLMPADLIRADEVFLTGSVRGVEPVGSIDEVDCPPPGQVTERVAAELRRLWLNRADA